MKAKDIMTSPVVTVGPGTSVHAELERQPWWHSTIANVSVTKGVVEFRGTIDSEEERAAARIAAENIPGVRRVEDRRFSIYEVPVSV